MPVTPLALLSAFREDFLENAAVYIMAVTLSRIHERLGFGDCSPHGPNTVTDAQRVLDRVHSDACLLEEVVQLNAQVRPVSPLSALT